MDEKELIRKWKRDEKAHFEGWDFSYIKKRMKSDKLPWDYIRIAKKIVKKSNSLLDIDTGGGEVLLKLCPLPKKAYAIEGYKPNVKVARRNLRKAGVKVIETNSAHKLPFKDGSFDLVINRHGAINASDIYRIMKKGGIFFTQQVDASKNFINLIKAFNGKPKWTFNNLAYRKRELKKLGFEILDSREWKGNITFKDVGAIVYLLKSTPWIVDGFSVDSHLKYLIKLEKRLEKQGKLVFTTANFMMIGRKR